MTSLSLCVPLLGSSLILLAQRRNLFRIMNTSEFSREKADWVEPGARLVLRDIVCQQCGVTKDVDLGVEITPQCECEEIDYRSNKMLIERRLIDLLRKKIIAWNIQVFKL